MTIRKKIMQDDMAMNRAMRRAQAQGKEYHDRQGGRWSETKKGKSRRRSNAPKPTLVLEWMSREES